MESRKRKTVQKNFTTRRENSDEEHCGKNLRLLIKNNFYEHGRKTERKTRKNFNGEERPEKKIGNKQVEAGENVFGGLSPTREKQKNYSFSFGEEGQNRIKIN